MGSAMNQVKTPTTAVFVDHSKEITAEFFPLNYQLEVNFLKLREFSLVQNFPEVEVMQAFPSGYLLTLNLGQIIKVSSLSIVIHGVSWEVFKGIHSV